MTSNRLSERSWFYGLLAVGILIKFTLYFYIVSAIPEAFHDADSRHYLADSDAFQAFFQNPQEGLTTGMLALPGYPFILFFWRHVLGLSVPQVIAVQIIFNFLTAVFAARIAKRINPQWEKWCFFIVLFDTPLTIYSQLIMTESFFVFFLLCFIYCFYRYCEKPGTGRLLLAGLTLLVCGCIRPAALYLPVVVAAFIFCYRTGGNWQKSIFHAIMILTIFYTAIFAWQQRNYHRYGDARLSSIEDRTVGVHSFLKDSDRKKDIVAPNMPAPLYYTYAFARNVLELVTTPGSARHVKSRGWQVFAKSFGYFVIVFWLPGFITGLTWGGKDKRFNILIWIFLYFLCATIWATGWTVTARFRIAMLPSIAIIAAAGWEKIRQWKNQ